MIKNKFSLLIFSMIMITIILLSARFFIYDPMVREKKKNQMLDLIHFYFKNEEYDIARDMTQRLLQEEADDQTLITLLNKILLFQKEEKLKEQEKRLSELADLITKYSEMMIIHNQRHLNRINDYLTSQMSKPGHPDPVSTDQKEIKKTLNAGIKYFNENDLPRAKEKFRQVLKIDQNNPYANAYYGAVLYQENPFDNKRMDTAIQKCIQAIEENNTIEIAHYVLARIYEKRRLYDPAIKEYMRTLEINPDHYLAHYRVGMIFSSLNRYDEAIQYLNNSIRVNQEFVDGYFFLAETESRLEHYAKALAYLNQLLVIDPQFYQAYVKKAEIYRLQKEYEKAIKNFDLALAINQYYAYYYKLADCYEKSNQKEKAYAAYYQSITKNQFSTAKEQLYLLNAYKKIIDIKLESNQKLDALSFARQGIDRLGDQALDLYHISADLNFQLKRYKNAANDYQKILSLDKATDDKYLFYYRLGQCCFESNNLQKAQIYLSRSIELNQHYYSAYEAMVKLMVVYKDYQKARQWIAKFKQSEPANKTEMDTLLALVNKRQRMK